MPRTRIFKKKEEKANKKLSGEIMESNKNDQIDGVLSKNLIPQPFLNFIKIMVPQIKHFEQKSQ